MALAFLRPAADGGESAAADDADGSGLVASAIVVLSDRYHHGLFTEFVCEAYGARAAGGLAAVRSAAAGMVATLAEHTVELEHCWAHPCSLHVPLSTALGALQWSTDTLLLAALAALTEQKLLLHAPSAHVLLPAVELVVWLLYPLHPCGRLIPLLPDGLMADVETLVNDVDQAFKVQARLKADSKGQPDEIL